MEKLILTLQEFVAKQRVFEQTILTKIFLLRMNQTLILKETKLLPSVLGLKHQEMVHLRVSFQK